MNAVQLYLDSLNQTTSRVSMKFALISVLRHLKGSNEIDTDHGVFSYPWHKLSLNEIRQLQQDLVAKFAPTTANLYMHALKGVLYYSWRSGALTKEEYLERVDFDFIHEDELPTAGRILHPSAITDLCNACYQSPAPQAARDHAIIALLYTCGMRKIEVASILYEALEIQNSTHGLIYFVKMEGSYNQEREIYINPQTKELIDRWLYFRGTAPGPLICSVKRLPVPLKMTGQAIYDVLKRKTNECITPEDLRKTASNLLLENDFSITQIQQFLGYNVAKNEAPEASEMVEVGVLLATVL